MIDLSFPSTRPKKVWPVSSYLPSQSSALPAPQGVMIKLWETAKLRAEKLGITPYEWINRDKLVQAAAARVPFHVGSIGVIPEHRREYYKTQYARVTGIAYSYSDIDNSEWDPDKIYVLTGVPIARGETPNTWVKCGEPFVATWNYLSPYKEEKVGT